MKVLVTGASGNLGTALRRRLEREEDVEVVGLVRRPPRQAGGVRWVEADLASPASVPVLERELADADAVVHLAWLLQPSHDEAVLRAANVDGTRRVATAAAAAGVHLVHASSVGTYAPRATPVPDGAAGEGADPRDAVGEDWPTTGIESSSYSRHKVAAERVLDEVQRAHPDARIARMRPGLVLQADAGSEIGRYFIGALLPLSLVRRVVLPVLPLPEEIVFQVVHADDVAEAVLRMLRTRAQGPFNLVTSPVVDRMDVAAALRVQRVPRLPVGVLRALAAATWRARLQPTEAGWVDLLTQVPLLSSALARHELGWEPRVPSQEALVELVDALGRGHGAATPPLRPRGLLSARKPPSEGSLGGG
ncbi:NAD-dependent epimerase/dehydratase family protein [uncultured Pseudokineococcus sp.]|uniref:NAD-dependent epimerase/dehydratase family protein n=1 Tax=uncultured Pseudokineococcus sp. TaxID=1642928 RepID=UPI002614BA68|nr:NAD-dependent epimerase/dehydratase family protein [uncultured Pseudokineococcus sp.]